MCAAYRDFGAAGLGKIRFLCRDSPGRASIKGAMGVRVKFGVSSDMRRGGKTRTFIKWTLLSLTVASLGLCILSGWMGFGLSWKSQFWRQATLHGGMVKTWWIRSEGLPNPGYAPASLNTTIVQYVGFNFYMRYSLGNPLILHFPAWIVPSMTAIPTALLFRSDWLTKRRRRVGVCPRCSFSLVGLAPDAKCPECGKARDEKQKTPSQ